MRYLKVECGKRNIQGELDLTSGPRVSDSTMENKYSFSYASSSIYGMLNIKKINTIFSTFQINGDF